MFNKIRKIVVNFSVEQETNKRTKEKFSLWKLQSPKLRMDVNSRLDTAEERLSETEARFRNIQNQYKMQEI